MLRNHLKMALRYLAKNRVHSFINIAGLSAGLAVTMLIGLWIWDELSFDKYHDHYGRIAQVYQFQTFNDNTNAGKSVPMPLAAELRASYAADFRYIVLSSWNWGHVLTVGDKNLVQQGSFMEPDAPELFSLTMLKGTRADFRDPSSLFLSRSAARALFGDADPMGRIVLVDNLGELHVAGVYEDLPFNTTLHNLYFLGPWNFYFMNVMDGKYLSDWNNNGFQLFVQLADNVRIGEVSSKISDIRLRRLGGVGHARMKPRLFLQPMSKWHLYEEFKNGVNTGGRIEYVWLFAVIGCFVLALACINFMNLSTARSEKRAREVGIRKAMGSMRGQLIGQFFCESLIVTFLSFLLSLLLAALALPYFNKLAGKHLSILWGNPAFWLLGISFCLVTGLIAGSYPAFYLSSFRPVKVLKGLFKAGREAVIPRRVLVVLQFTVSVMLIIGTIVVFKQIHYAMDRPVGYDRRGLIAVPMATDEFYSYFESLRLDLLRSGAVSDAALATSATTQVSNYSTDLEWEGKDPRVTVRFATIGVTHEYGKTVGFEFLSGRDFSRDFLTDSSAAILNEAAVRSMGLKDPLGQTIKWGDDNFTVIGVVKDMVMESPYEPVQQTIFYLRKKFDPEDFLNIRLNPNDGTAAALEKVGAVCKVYSPSAPFEYKFADEEYARKFNDEQRIGEIAGFFTILAIFISCLGLFGMAAFMAEQRIREIGVRKVLGASVFSLWRLLSREFVILVAISTLIAIPPAYYFMHGWLSHYQYRSGIPWWIFAAVAAGSMVITLLTVSYQSIRAALVSPVKSLRSE
jgi:putative ABC transport system permease protein